MKTIFVHIFLISFIYITKANETFLSDKKDSTCLHCISNKILTLQSLLDSLVRKYKYNKDKVNIDIVNKETGMKNNVLPFELSKK